MAKEQLATEVAGLLVSRQPLAIRSRLDKGGVLEGIGLRTYHGLVVANTSVLLHHLFASARKLGFQQPEEQLRVVSGGEAHLSRSEGSYVLSVRQGDQLTDARLSSLGMLSPEQDERLGAFEETVRQLGPTSDISAFQATVEERPLGDDEMEAIIAELSHGVTGVQGRLLDKLQKGRMSLQDLVPDSFEYFEKFCGPNPGETSPDEYLRSILPAYRQELLRRDLRKGLEICLLGSLRDDLCPGAWLEEIDNEVLWSSLVDCQSDLDPVSLLAALDLALYRQEDDRFRSLAEDAVHTLVEDQFLRSDGGDAYRLIPLLASFVLNRINLMDGGALRPAFWKRLCAWMQATLIARLAAPVDIDYEVLSEALARSMEIAGEHANTLDLRKEPMVEAGSTSFLALRREIVGRLLLLPERHPAASGGIPGINEIEQACVQLRNEAPPWSWRLPGPLEGYRRPQEAGKILPEGVGARLLELSGADLIANLANMSQHFSFGAETKELLCATISRELKEADLERRLVSLLSLATITAAERDASLAETAAEGVLRLAPDLEDRRMIWAAVETILRAAAAFEDKAAWAEWLERQFLALSNRIPPGNPATILWYHLKELKKVTRLEFGILRRAEGAAQAAASYL